MMKSILPMIAACALLFPWAGAQADVRSLRGAEIGDNSVPSEVRRYIGNDRLVRRNFVQQPPVIPHSIDGYRVDLRNNKCLSCHSWSNYEEARATKISITHFRDRDGNDLADVAGIRYFCPQCHVPQADLPGLVENRFQPVREITPGR